MQPAASRDRQSLGGGQAAGGAGDPRRCRPQAGTAGRAEGGSMRREEVVRAHPRRQPHPRPRPVPRARERRDAQEGAHHRARAGAEHQPPPGHRARRRRRGRLRPGGGEVRGGRGVPPAPHELDQLTRASREGERRLGRLLPVHVAVVRAVESVDRQEQPHAGAFQAHREVLRFPAPVQERRRGHVRRGHFPRLEAEPGH
mmetsp:Transcript_108642/g.307236  ORF Transcript_108642/g.307236 Transcript_108642/m.307236 type:complete len:200 (-) Transcript_108642:400-999(-)